MTSTCIDPWTVVIHLHATSKMTIMILIILTDTKKRHFHHNSIYLMLACSFDKPNCSSGIILLMIHQTVHFFTMATAMISLSLSNLVVN